MSIKSLKVESAVSRVAIVAACVIALLMTYTFAKWSVGNSISLQTEYKEIADIAKALAPSDPQPHYTSAALLEKTFLPGDFEKSLQEYETATALSPNNYLLWLALGKARERSGDAEGAEKALRKAFELAPNYAQVQWTLGNVLLRRGKNEEAFLEIRRAVESDQNFANPAVSTAWQIFDGNIAEIRQAIGESPNTNAALAIFLARQKRFDEALDVWNSLPSEMKTSVFKQKGEELFNQFVEAKKIRAAQQISAQINASEAGDSGSGKIANGGFESEIKMKNAGLFEWHVVAGNHPQIGLDNQSKRGGEHSLFLIFNSADGKEFRQISQTVPVEPGKNYRFSAAYKSDLKAPATVRWEITDAADGRVIAVTEAAAEKSDWANLSIDFSAGEAEGIVVKLARANCKSQICPISGKLWFDDITLSPTNQ
jgi:thioredoxin-like negative regulator of GroEL